MDFDDTPDEADYRAHVRSVLDEHAGELLHLDPGEEAPDARQREADLRRTQRVLADYGLVGVLLEHGAHVRPEGGLVRGVVEVHGAPLVVEQVGLSEPGIRPR